MKDCQYNDINVNDIVLIYDKNNNTQVGMILKFTAYFAYVLYKKKAKFYNRRVANHKIQLYKNVVRQAYALELVERGEQILAHEKFKLL